MKRTLKKRFILSPNSIIRIFYSKITHVNIPIPKITNLPRYPLRLYPCIPFDFFVQLSDYKLALDITSTLYNIQAANLILCLVVIAS